MLRAGIAHVRGDAATAATLLQAGLEGFVASDMGLNAAVARGVLGALRPGEQGRALRRESAQWFGDQSVKRPHRFVRMLAPGFARIEAS